MGQTAPVEDHASYNADIERMRPVEYPMLKGRFLGWLELTVPDATYLDHAGTTLVATSLLNRFAADVAANLYGNPHSASPSSQRSTSRIDDVRLRVLRFFHASPDDFDVVFVANATAGIKLVLDGFRSLEDGFVYGYHRDAHTSLVGVRETAVKSSCLDDGAVEEWLADRRPLVEASATAALFAYPAQSNMNGRRLPLAWLERARAKSSADLPIYTLLDAAAMVSTAPLDLSDSERAPDFTALSFYKIFGFPDLGALIVRKQAGDVLRKRQYFGGGTVDMVVCVKERWHAFKEQSLHESLEDGTLPIHNIIALDAALDVHKQLFRSVDHVARHTSFLARQLYGKVMGLRHHNGSRVCEVYSPGFEGDIPQGPIIAFNLRNSHGAWIGGSEVEKLANVRNIHLRTGGLCNPGGIATSLGLEPWEMMQNFSAGLRCGSDKDVMGGKPTGVVRVSLGAMSTLADVAAFIAFLEEFFVETTPLPGVNITQPPATEASMVVQSLTIYPIKSCGGYLIPPGVDWEVKREGLAWDREWFLVHQGTGRALTQKNVPRMALIKPIVDLAQGVLRIRLEDSEQSHVVSVPLSHNPQLFHPVGAQSLSSRVCGDAIRAPKYRDADLNALFTSFLGVPCTLARFPAGGMGSTTRHSKAHLQRHQQRGAAHARPSTLPSPPTPPDSDSEPAHRHPILLSNESPILGISAASLAALNASIRAAGGKQAPANVFRSNIVFAPARGAHATSTPYAEDSWMRLRIAPAAAAGGRTSDARPPDAALALTLLGACRRCQMVCVDQETAQRDPEPLATLAKERRLEGGIFFGVHMCLETGGGAAAAMAETRVTPEVQWPRIRVGDVVTVEGR